MQYLQFCRHSVTSAITVKTIKSVLGVTSLFCWVRRDRADSPGLSPWLLLLGSLRREELTKFWGRVWGRTSQGGWTGTGGQNLRGQGEGMKRTENLKVDFYSLKLGLLLPHPWEKASMSFTVLQGTFLGLAKTVRLFQREILSTGLVPGDESSVGGLSKKKKRKKFLCLFSLDCALFLN